MTATLNVEMVRSDQRAARAECGAAVQADERRPGRVRAGYDRRPGGARPTGTTGKPATPTNKGTVWVYDNDQLRAVPVTIGASDGTLHRSRRRRSGGRHAGDDARDVEKLRECHQSDGGFFQSADGSLAA